jgi:hypothetical protein
VPHGGTVSDFTSERNKTRQAVDLIAGKAPRTPRTAQEASCHTRDVLDQVSGVITAVPHDAVPTTVVLLSTGLVGPDAIVTKLGGANVGGCTLSADHFEGVATATAGSGAEFYIVRANVGVISATATESTVGLEHLAGVTGTQVMPLSQGSDSSLTRIVRETSAFYQVAFDVDPSERNSRPHRFEVKSPRPDVTLRAQPTVIMARPDAPKSSAAKTPKDTLRDAMAYTDLQVRATAFSSRNSGDEKMKVVAGFEPLDPAVTFATAAAGLFKGDTLVAQWTSKPEDLAAKPALAAMLAPPGTYRLRVAGADAAGHLGVVDQTITVELATAGSLKLSSILLGVPKTGGGMAPKLEFASEPTATVYFELYGGQTNMQLGAVVEIAAGVNEPALATAQPKWGGTSEPDKFTGTAELPIASLAPGDYVVRAIVGVAGMPEGRVMRTLRKR